MAGNVSGLDQLGRTARDLVHVQRVALDHVSSQPPNRQALGDLLKHELLVLLQHKETNSPVQESIGIERIAHLLLDLGLNGPSDKRTKGTNDSGNELGEHVRTPS